MEVNFYLRKRLSFTTLPEYTPVTTRHAGLIANAFYFIDPTLT